MLSACLITRDAAHLLPACVANLRRFADEVVIVADAASTDATADVARALADTAVVWDTGGLGENVLNEGVALCRGDWVLWCNDDELYPPAWIARLPDWLAGPSREYVFSRRHIVGDGDRWITSEPWWPDWQVRLRHRAAWLAAPWPKRPHSSPEAHGRTLVNQPFWHLKFVVQDLQTRLARMNRWGELWQPATGEHYRKFAVAEDFTWHTAAIDEDAPPELAQMLAACATAAPPGVVC